MSPSFPVVIYVCFMPARLRKKVPSDVAIPSLRDIDHALGGRRSDIAGEPVKSGETSLDFGQTQHHHGRVSMYIGILSDALQTWPQRLTGDALVDHAVNSRVHMLSAR